MVNGMNNLHSAYNGFINYSPYQSAVDFYQQKKELIFPNAKDNEEEKKRKSHALTKAVASTVIVASIAGLLLAKGGSGRFHKYLNKLIQNADNVIYKLTKSQTSLNISQKVSLVIIKSCKFLLEKANAMNNFTALKDSGFMYLSEKLHFKKACDAVTKLFRSISINGSRGYHLKAQKVVDSNCEELRLLAQNLQKNSDEMVNIGGTTKSKKEWGEEVELMLKEMKDEYFNSSSTQARNIRIAGIDRGIKGLRKKVFDEIFNRNVLTHDRAKLRLYRTEALSAEGQKEFSETILKLKRNFSNDIEDNYKTMSEAMYGIRSIIKTNDEKGLPLARKLAAKIETYKKFSGPSEKDARDKIIAEIKTELEELKNAFAQEHYSDTTRELFETKLGEINFVLNDARKGKAEEIKTRLRRCLDEDSNEYAKAIKIMDKMTKAVKDAYNKELLLHTKLAELEVGSAPTDVLWALLPIGAAAMAVAQGDTKDEKIAATFKAGIPIVGGILMSIYCTARMIPNLKGLILGGGFGLGLNILGRELNDRYLDYKKEQLFTQKAIAEYKKKFQ